MEDLVPETAGPKGSDEGAKLNRALVTGCAGFVGSHLTERLLADGWTVVGLDSFSSYYDESAKRANLASAVESPEFSLIEADIRTAALESVLDGIDVVFHQAAQPGVRLSWSAGFAEYDSVNVLGTQRLLEAARTVGTSRLVYASSSSVYGNAARYPTMESDNPAPHSPYGVTKLAAEHLVNLYAANYGLSGVSLRYFTVYGPRQRPDMAMRRLVDAAFGGDAFPLYGDGSQMRDFTYVADVVEANVRAGTVDVAPGTVVNIAGGSEVTMNEVIELISELSGRELNIERHPPQEGDVARTGGSVDEALHHLGWSPAFSLREGLERMVEWRRSLYEAEIAGSSS